MPHVISSTECGYDIWLAFTNNKVIQFTLWLLNTKNWVGSLASKKGEAVTLRSTIWELNFAINHKEMEMVPPSTGEPSDKTVAPIYVSLQPVRVSEAEDPDHPGWTPHSQTGWMLILVHWLCHKTDTHEWADTCMLLWTANQLSDILPLTLDSSYQFDSSEVITKWKKTSLAVST